MFLYNEDIEEEKLVISIPSKVQYDFTFLNNTTEMMKKVEQSQYKKILFSCMEKNINFDKMGAAYLYNMLVFFAKTRSIFIDKPLYQIFHNKVSHSGGEQFDKIDIKKVSRSDIQQCYSIKNDKYVNQIVQILVDFISENNLVLERAREFLITTVGEIFSNAFGHSNEEKVFFMYDIGTFVFLARWDQHPPLSDPLYPFPTSFVLQLRQRRRRASLKSQPSQRLSS